MAPRVCIYTAICGEYDTLEAQPEQAVACDFVCFTDEPERLSGAPWRVVPIGGPQGPAGLRARLAKAAPHAAFEALGLEYDVTIWVDGNVRVLRPGFAGHFVEAARETGVAALARPGEVGCFDTRVVARDMRSPLVRRAGEAWRAALLRGSGPDAFSSALREAGARCRALEVDPRRNALFELRPHADPLAGGLVRRAEYSARPFRERPGGDRPGVYEPERGLWRLGGAGGDRAFAFGPPGRMLALVGDWDGDGADGPGVYDPATGTFFLRNTCDEGPADVAFVFGPPGAVPVAGDWDGDGRDGVGVFVRGAGYWALANRLGPGAADVELHFGAAGTAMLPVAGDWDGEGRDLPGLYDPASAAWFLLTEPRTGGATTAFEFGPERGLPVAGDWNGDGVDEVGVYVPEQGQAFLADANRAAAGCARLLLDPPGALPVAGRAAREAARAEVADDDADVRNVAATGMHERILPEDLVWAPGHVARYAFAAHWAAGCRVLDLCCGAGYGSNMLAAAGARRVFGVDLSADAVAYARSRYGSDSVEFFCADATGRLPVSHAHVVTCFEAVEHVDRPDRLLENVAAALAPGGVALVSSPNGAYYPGGFSGNPYHVKEYTRAEFEALVGARFARVELFFQWEHGDPSGPPPGRRAGDGPARHPGDAAFDLRPLPAALLSHPEAPDEEPLVWVALCRDPRT